MLVEASATGALVRVADKGCCISMARMSPAANFLNNLINPPSAVARF